MIFISNTPEYNRQYRENNREKVKQLCKDWRGKNKEHVKEYEYYYYRKTKGRTKKNSDLIRTYGITLAEYESLVEKQNGLCSICRKSPRRCLVVDHHHEANKVRELLCERCNSGLGMFGEDISILISAIGYLREHQVSCKEQPSP